MKTSPRILKPGSKCIGEMPIYIRIPTAAALLDLSAAAFRKRLSRTDVPSGVVRRWGRSILIHRDRFLAWLESEGAEAGDDQHD